MRRLIVLAIALLISTPSFATGTHPAPVPPPVETPAAITAPAWLFWVMALPIVGFAVQHYLATKGK